MMKLALCAVAALSLSACLDGGSAASVSRLDTLSASCSNANMGTLNALPMRCGPQVAAPHSHH